MKRVIQSLDTGKTDIENTPIPKVESGEVLIKNKIFSHIQRVLKRCLLNLENLVQFPKQTAT